jgi:hypothetical protein
MPISLLLLSPLQQCVFCPPIHPADASQTFAKKDLPKEHRVLGPDSFSTADFKPERLNIHVDEDGTVKGVKFG